MRPADADVLFLLLVKAENRALVSHLSAANVDFVVIGGVALASYGLREVTAVDDLDLLVAPTPANADRIASALSSAGVPLGFPSSCLARPSIQVPLKARTPYWAELLTPPKEFEFAEIYAGAVLVEKAGLALRIASLPHLRELKEFAVSLLRQDLSKHEHDLSRMRCE